MDTIYQMSVAELDFSNPVTGKNDRITTQLLNALSAKNDKECRPTGHRLIKPYDRISTLGDLVKQTENSLLERVNLGKDSLARIKLALKRISKKISKERGVDIKFALNAKIDANSDAASIMFPCASWPATRAPVRVTFNGRRVPKAALKL